MLVQILQFLLEIASGLVSGACLLRLYMQVQRVPFQNSVGQLVFALSDWLVMPLRRVVPVRGRYDLSSLVAAVLVQLLYYLLLWTMAGMLSPVLVVPVLALFGLLRMVLTGFIGILLVYAILSWVSPHAPVASILSRLGEPLLRPVRRVVPLVGGVDLSPLLVLIVLQVLLMVLAHWQFEVQKALAASMLL